jgi:hypothetical protein
MFIPALVLLAGIFFLQHTRRSRSAAAQLA